MSRPTVDCEHLVSMPNRIGNLYVLGEIPYRTAWQWQQQLVAAHKAAAIAPKNTANKNTPNQDKARPKDALLLLQHPPVYTLGQGADARFLRFDPNRSDAECYRVERGGEVTYHCPGQLVGYPILNLRHYRLDLHWYLRQLEEVLIRVLACFGLEGQRVDGLTGVWLEGHKVAAIGIKVSRWIAMHGFSLNVCPDLRGFEKIVPCGLEGKPVGSLAQFLPEIDVAAVQQALIEQFQAVFQLSLQAAPASDLRLAAKDDL